MGAQRCGQGGAPGAHRSCLQANLRGAGRLLGPSAQRPAPSALAGPCTTPAMRAALRFATLKGSLVRGFAFDAFLHGRAFPARPQV